MPRMLVLAVLLVFGTLVAAQSRPLDIYWIDVEGGAATLIVAPSGESMLLDTGFDVPGRDAKRIHAAALAAGLRRIDHVVISHYHRDHVGGLTELATLMPLGRFYGPGDEIEPANVQWLNAFRTAAGTNRTIAKPGDVLPVKGIAALIVSSDRKFLERPLAGGGPNALCADAERKAPAGLENERMVGVMLTYGRFKFLTLTDLDWAMEMELVCPVNKLGTVTIYQSGRHGSFDGAGSPPLVGAIRPQVVVFNNGPRKGLGQVDDRAKSVTPAGVKTRPYERNGYARAAALPGIEGIWQVHRSLLDANPAHNTAPDMIANLEEEAGDQGHWIKASVEADGRFTIVNGRNNVSRSYTAR